MNKWIKIICISLILLGLDSLMKLYTFLHIPKMTWLHPFFPYGGIAIFKNIFGISLSFNYVANKGAAWGFFSNYSIYLFYLRVIIIFVLLIYLISTKLSFKNKIPFVLILTGAIGNILDHIFYGHVIDMIHFTFGSYSAPVFNFADILISIGITYFVINSFFFKKVKT